MSMSDLDFWVEIKNLAVFSLHVTLHIDPVDIFKDVIKEETLLIHLSDLLTSIMLAIRAVVSHD